MIAIITLCYLGCVYLAFKVIKIKVSAVSCAVSALTGVFLIGGIVIVWKFSAPTTGRMTVKRDVIPLVSGQSSSEFITKIHVPLEQMVSKGDPLYEVDPRPRQFEVDQLKARLAEAVAKVAELEASVAVAEAAVEASRAAQDFAKAQLDTAAGVQRDNPAAVAELKVTLTEQQYESAQAAVRQAIASESETRFALAGMQETVRATEASLQTAQLNLDQCVVRAPADGCIMAWQAVEGTMTTSLMTAAQGTFMDMSSTVVGAVFPQNLLANVRPGDHVEIAFRSLPGELATGKVDQILEYSGEGQLEPSGVLPVVAEIAPSQLLVVRIKLDDDELARQLPLGGAGTTAIYTEFAAPFHLISKIVMRMKAWAYYAPI